MKVVLLNPQIPQNTGNIARTCAVVGCELILVRPLGFQISDRWLKRAGLDYWDEVAVQVIDDLTPLLEEKGARFTFFSSKAKKHYHEVEYQANDFLIFGSETEGLPPSFWKRWPDHFAKVPMKNSVRCLNLATCAGIAIYEAWRQQNFTPLK